MATPISRNDIPALLLLILKGVMGKMSQKRLQYKDIYSTEGSEKAFETTAMMKYLGYASVKEEGSALTMDSAFQRYTTTVKHQTLAIGYEITNEALKDNLYKDDFPRGAIAMKDSIRAAEELMAANILNRAFDPAYPVGDGQAACSTTHQISGATASNAFAGGGATVDLSELGIEQALIAIQSFPMESGILADIQAERLLIPKELQFTASRLTTSEYMPETGNNDRNPIFGIFKQAPSINYQLLSPTAWFILTDASRALVHYEREGVELDSFVDPKTKNYMASAMKRLSFVVNDWRGLFGSPGI